MLVLGGTTFFRDGITPSFMIFSKRLLRLIFSFVGIKWRQFLITKLPFLFKMLYERGRSFGTITDPFLFHVFSSSVLFLPVLTGF